MDYSVVIDNLSASYADVPALSRVTMAVPPSSSVAVIGPNGSGKSTLLKVIAGVLRPDGGTVDLGGRSMAFVLQSTDVDPGVPLTVYDTVAMARFPQTGLLGRLRPADRTAISSALGSLGLDDLVDRQIHDLSGGQRQRTFVAQGLAQGADVVLLDEPLTGLDVNSQALIGEALEEARQAGRTTIVSTHSFAEAGQCDFVLLLATKQIAFGPPDKVLTELHLRQAFGGRFVRVGNTIVLDDPHHEHVH